MLSPWQIGNEKLFQIVARAFYAETDIIGIKPKFNLKQFGESIGLELDQIVRLRENARNYVSNQRRTEMGLSQSQFGGRQALWISSKGNKVLMPA